MLINKSQSLLILVLISLQICSSTYVQLPALLPERIINPEQKLITINENQQVKISTAIDGLQTIKLNASENNQPISFCQVIDRHVNFEPIKSLLLYTPDFNEHGFANTDLPYTISWSVINPIIELFDANIISLDNYSLLKFFIVNPSTNTTNLVKSFSLQNYIKTHEFILNQIQISQAGKSIFVAFQIANESQQIRLLKVSRSFTELNQLIIEEQKQIVLKNTEGELISMISFQIPLKQDSLLFILQDQKLNVLWIDEQDRVKQDLQLTKLISLNPDIDFVDVRLYYPSDNHYDSNHAILNIYILCAVNGIFKYEFNINNPINQIINQDTQFLIKVENGDVFNLYRGRIFFVATTSDIYQVREFEVSQQNGEDYYLNRVHEVDHKVKDIVVYDYYIIILGSNSHTITWHSIHPQLFDNILEKQQYFSAFGLHSGVVIPLKNTTSGQTDPYFLGFQRRHIYINKIVSVGAYLSCNPTNGTLSHVGEHNVQISFISNNFQSNSYEVQEYLLNWTIQVNKVYADGLTAGMIAGIVIGVLILLTIIILIIYAKVKRQRRHKDMLYSEIRQHNKRSNSLKPLNQLNQIISESTPQNLRNQSEPDANYNFGIAAAAGNKPSLHQQSSVPQTQQDNPIIRFQEDDDE